MPPPDAVVARAAMDDRLDPSVTGRLRAALARVLNRIRIAHALRGIAAGALVAAGAWLILFVFRDSSAAIVIAPALLGMTAGVATFVWFRRQRTVAAAARAIEASDPSLRNVIVTAAELLAAPEGTRPYMRDRVLREADRRAAAIDLRRAVPLARDAGRAAALVLSALAAVSAGQVFATRPTGDGGTGVAGTDAAAVHDAEFTIELVPPSYSGRPPVRWRNPASLDVLAESRAVIRIPLARMAGVRLNGAAIPVNRNGIAETTLTESGYLAIEGGPLHRLLPVTVTPDRAPEVRITAPAKDLRVAAAAAIVPISATAVDDLGLRSFDIRYTVVSGSGEQFAFTEGRLPVTIARASPQSWHADTTLSLAALKLEPGDALIYRAVAADQRPGGAGEASSDTFFVEVAGPGDVALEGVDMAPDTERYALSEAMIVLKIERLQGRERGLSQPALQEAAGDIAAEQRAVRANFIFLLGGEVEDEEVEAATSHEIQEGRFANQARQEIVAATVLMGRVEQALAGLSTKDALSRAREAVRALQRAFGHSRYLLRALPSRVRIDPSRRLSGDLAAASDWNRALVGAGSDPESQAARDALLDLLIVARTANKPSPAAGRSAQIARLNRLAERVLSIGTAGDLQISAREIGRARDALSAGQTETAMSALQRAAPPLVLRAQRGRIDSVGTPHEQARLAGALARGGRGGK
jgi:hypothetical protein